jgi:hypothetical protein
MALRSAGGDFFSRSHSLLRARLVGSASRGGAEELRGGRSAVGNGAETGSDCTLEEVDSISRKRVFKLRGGFGVAKSGDLSVRGTEEFRTVVCTVGGAAGVLETFVAADGSTVEDGNDNDSDVMYEAKRIAAVRGVRLAVAVAGVDRLFSCADYAGDGAVDDDDSDGEDGGGSETLDGTDEPRTEAVTISDVLGAVPCCTGSANCCASNNSDGEAGGGSKVPNGTDVLLYEGAAISEGTDTVPWCADSSNWCVSIGEPDDDGP